MREAITADIRKHREMEAKRLKQNQIGEILLAAHDFEVPETLVEEEVGKSLQNYARFLASQGVDIEKAEIDWRKMQEEFRPEAVKRVKRALILEQIAKKENLIVSDVEVDAEIRRAAKEADRDFAEVKHRLRHDGGYEAVADVAEPGEGARSGAARGHGAQRVNDAAARCAPSVRRAHRAAVRVRLRRGRPRALSVGDRPRRSPHRPAAVADAGRRRRRLALPDHARRRASAASGRCSPARY